ncbi:uncharacterized protein LOC118409297 [Branchiostoma floridae]|uniref:Uncharacterized protein LOC118409297 n=1 Tax=Branchiostoma floridae TaxID=7739 RepID=C3ZGL3_BRAFL|nr:uncharacterized protein LOC118409297 [Branchiostoma floridae]|eukprot:XP_002592228.1 hypothetical protein BRAFLDRAFT_119613 [Branchiostoma floridae]
MKYLSIFLVLTAAALTTFNGAVGAETDGSQAVESGLNPRQKSLLRMLSETRKLHWDAGMEYAIAELMKDVDKGVDPESEDEKTKIGVERFTDQVEKFDEGDKEKVMKVFRQSVGKTETKTIFQDASKLAKEEDESLKTLKKDVGFDANERRAFKELVADEVKGNDPEKKEKAAELSLMANAEEKVDKLSQLDKQRLRAMIASKYGEELATRVFDEAETIEKEEEDKMAASKKEETAKPAQTAGTTEDKKAAAPNQATQDQAIPQQAAPNQAT